MATTKYSLISAGTTEQWKSVDVAITNAATNSAEIAMGPYTIGGIANTTAGTLVFTLSAASSNGGNALALLDSAGNAVANLTVATNSYHVIPSSIESVPYLIVHANAAAATGVTLHFKRQG